MEKNKKQKEPQLHLGLEYTGNKTLERIRYKSRKFFIFLDQFAFWRSPLLWLFLFVNIVIGYLFFTSFHSASNLPPTIPLLYYLPSAKSIIVPTDYVPMTFGIHWILQAVCIYLAAKQFYRLKLFSNFILLSATLSSLLFFVAIFKSITVTLPSV